MKRILLAALFLLTPLCLMAAPSSQFGSVSLGWSYDFVSNPGVIGFNIYYGTNATAIANWDTNTNQCQCYQFVLPTGSTATSATVTGLVRGVTYYFNVTPLTASEEGSYCNEARQAIPTKPGKASNLIIIGVN